MLRSMFTAISALNQNQSYLDVIADNLANSNTTAFKASRVTFQSQFSQLLSPGSAPAGTSGGINPLEIGLGSRIGATTAVFTQGMLQSTGRALDVAVQGEGFLIYNNGSDRRFSREGSLEIDAGGYLSNTITGLRVQGWQIENGSTDPIDPNAPIGDIQVDLGATLARSTTMVNLGGNLDSRVAVGGTIETTIGVFDSLGYQHDVNITFTRTGDRSWDWDVTGPDASAAGAGTLTFDEFGQRTGSTIDTALTYPGSTGAEDVEYEIDLTNLTMLVAPTGIAQTGQNGLAAGSVSDVYIAPNSGEVYLAYSNGLKEKIGQLALAKFTNPSGLMRSGQNTYALGLNSGDPQIGTANSGGRGKLVPSYLEGSNVDMAQEFTNMILAQRGFQASSRIITTSDEILSELVNLKR